MGDSRFSSDVLLSLIVNGRTIRLSQIWPGHVSFQQPTSLPACDGEIVMSVDGRERRWSVRLVDGAQPFDDVARAMHCVEPKVQDSPATAQ